MNIELDEVVVLDVSDQALELAAGGAQWGGLLGAGGCFVFFPGVTVSDSGGY